MKVKRILGLFTIVLFYIAFLLVKSVAINVCKQEVTNVLAEEKAYQTSSNVSSDVLGKIAIKQ